MTMEKETYPLMIIGLPEFSTNVHDDGTETRLSMVTCQQILEYERGIVCEISYGREYRQT